MISAARQRIRTELRKLFGLASDATLAQGSIIVEPAVRLSRRTLRLQRDARAYARETAAQRIIDEEERIAAEEEFRIRLEQRGSIFPGDV